MTPPRTRPDIILITLDQWRWDALAAAGSAYFVHQRAVADPLARRWDNGGLRGPMRGGDVYHPPRHR
jgi:hypothetical protein